MKYTFLETRSDTDADSVIGIQLGLNENVLVSHSVRQKNNFDRV